MRTMIQTISKKLFLTINHVWFLDSNVDIKKLNGNILFLHGVRDNIVFEGNFAKNAEQKTLITDLTNDETVLWQGISKTYRNEIRRCEKEERRSIFLSSKEILERPDIIEVFERTYNEMFLAKGMSDKFNKNLFKAYAKNNALVVSIAYREEQPVVFHTYIIDDKNARFWYSCSNFREDKEIAEEIGRLNKFLHWKDLMEMKSRGIRFYDWGGIGLSVETRGIAEFKRKFGGNELTYLNCIYAKNRIVNMLLKWYFNR